VGKTLKEIVKRDIEDELNAIKLYKQVIETTQEEKDVTTAFTFIFIFKEILEDEEDHHDTFTTLMEDLKWLKKPSTSTPFLFQNKIDQNIP
jgi:bacterioferritin